MVDRRDFLKFSAVAAGSLFAASAGAVMRPSGERSLALYNTHTGESLAATYWARGAYLADGLAEIHQILRDHRTGELFPMDPRLLDLLYALRGSVQTEGPFHVISGYRSPATNARLRHKGRNVATRSLHMQGQAIDIRLPGHDLAALRRAALALQGGGVGYYSRADFIHVDVGRVRFW